MSEVPTTKAALARFIDHTVLKPEATVEQIDRLCDECLEYNFAAACVNPVWVEHCVRRLAGSSTAVAAVAGFPLGASLPATKADEARRAVKQGAREIDMVVNLGALIAGDRGAVRRDIEAVVAAVVGASKDATVKVILETAALSDEQVVLGCRCAAEAQADYVKTSTGFHPAGGATVEHVAMLAQARIAAEGQSRGRNPRLGDGAGNDRSRGRPTGDVGQRAGDAGNAGGLRAGSVMHARSASMNGW